MVDWGGEPPLSPQLTMWPSGTCRQNQPPEIRWTSHYHPFTCVSYKHRCARMALVNCRHEWRFTEMMHRWGRVLCAPCATRWKRLSNFCFGWWMLTWENLCFLWHVPSCFQVHDYEVFVLLRKPVWPAMELNKCASTRRRALSQLPSPQLSLKLFFCFQKNLAHCWVCKQLQKWFLHAQALHCAPVRQCNTAGPTSATSVCAIYHPRPFLSPPYCIFFLLTLFLLSPGSGLDWSECTTAATSAWKVSGCVKRRRRVLDRCV